MLDAIQEEMKRLDLRDGRIKPTVANLKIIASVKNKMLRLVVTDDYKAEVKEFVQAFRDVSKLQNEYWRSVESTFKPRSILKQIRVQAISDTVAKLTDAGIGVNIGDQIASILNTNITTGGSYAALNDQLRELLTDTQKSDGLLTRYSKQITNDSIQQYNRNYTQIVSSDLGFEWYAYQGTDIVTTRPFCDAMTDIRYFHVSQIPDLLAAKDLYYIKDGKKTKVPIYERTGLPHGLIEGTDASNFFIRAGGHNCGHAIRPVPERNVPQEIKDKVYASATYQAWAKGNEITAQKPSEIIEPESNAVKTKLPKTKGEEIDIDALREEESEPFDWYLKNHKSVVTDTQKDFPDMTPEEILAVEIYGDTSYKRTNDYLRNESEYRSASKEDAYTQRLVKYQENYVKLMNQALDKLPNYESVVYRGGDFAPNILNQYITAFTKGSILTEKAFMSTSKHAGTALGGNTQFVIQSKTGKQVEKIMEHSSQGGASEGEVLFKPGTRFRVTGVKQQSGRTFISMEQV